MSKYKDHPLVEAARYNDAQAEEIGLEMTVEGAGLELPVLLHVARQRALRIVMLTTRGEKFMRQYATSGIPQIVPLSKAETDAADRIMLTYLDGILIGWKGHVLSLEKK